MSKEDTTILKGIAILLMLFLHLFSNPATAADYTPLLWIGSTPFATIFARACNPVNFFLVCSGYGLAYVYHNGKLNVASQWRRILKLYLNYWLILIIFVSIGCFVQPTRFPGSLTIAIENFTGLNTDGYDHPAWFLLPYSLLSLSSLWIFKAMDKLGIIKSLIVSFFLTFGSMVVISLYIAPNNYHHKWFTIIFTYFDLIFAFVLGACINYKFEKGKITINKLVNNQWLTILLLICWFAIHMLTGSAAFNPFFLIAFMIIFLNLKFKGVIRKVLLELGRKSMPMWLTHAYFYGYLCHDFIYGFKYSLVIFLILVLVSYLTAIVIQKLSHYTIERLPLFARRKG